MGRLPRKTLISGFVAAALVLLGLAALAMVRLQRTHESLEDVLGGWDRFDVAEVQHRLTSAGAEAHRGLAQIGVIAACGLAILCGLALVVRSVVGSQLRARRAADEAEQRSRRALKALSGCNQTLLRAEDEAGLLSDICQVIVGEAGYRLAWVGLAMHDEAKSVRPVAHAGYEAGYLDGLAITWADEGRGRGPTGTAIRTGESRICRNLTTDPAFALWRNDAVKRGYASSVSLPLFGERSVIGALNIYSADPDAFQPDEMELLTEMAADLAYGVSVLRARTEQRAVERSLRESEERYRSVISALAEGILLQVDEGRITECNRSAERIFGVSAAQIIGRTAASPPVPCLREDGAPLAADRHPAIVTLETGRPCHDVNIGIRRPDGNVAWLSVNAEPLYRPGETKPFAAVTSFTDVTERRSLEAKYLQAQKMEAFGQLAGGVAHDFNNILAVIVMQVSLLKLEPGHTPTSRRWLDELERLGQRAAGLTRQLLIFSRRHEMDMQPLDLNDAVEGICRLLQRILGEHIAFELRKAPERVVIHADPGMVEQVVMNLCVNARDAMPSGGSLTLEIGTGERAIEGDEAGRRAPHACLSVTDTGCGMDEATKRRLFEPFFTTKPVGRGTGLGLATIYGIMKQHHGAIDVESAPGKGSTFRVYFPLDVHLRPAAAPAAAPAGEFKGGNEKILLVEDEALVRESLAECLQRAGYFVVEAANGVDAIRRWHDQYAGFDLLITDMVMPEKITGLQVAEQLVRAKPSLRVIVVSGYHAETDEDDSPLAEKVTHLAKPVDAAKLLTTVRQVLDAEA